MKKILIVLLFSFVSLFAFEHLTPKNFDEKLKGKNVIVDFYAQWCPPCKVLAKSLEDFDMVKEDDLDVEIFKVDIEKYKDFAIKKGVNALPTIMFYKDGKMIAKEVGIRDVPQLTNSSKKYFK